MSEFTKVLLPKLGESIVSAVVVQWFKKVGDSVQLDEPLLEVSTDKVNSEIPSPVAGTITEIVAQVDETVEVGHLLAVIRSGSAGEKANEKVIPLVSTEELTRPAAENSTMRDFFSPALLRLARERGVSLDELEKVAPTGAGGRLTKKDLEDYIAKKVGSPKPCPLQPTRSASSPLIDVERIKMSGMRKAIADNMVRSFYEAPHATLVTEVDVTGILKLIQKEKEAFLERHGAKLTITAFIAKAISRALQAYPFLNSSLEQDTIVVKRFVNLGLAVSVDQGIMVPVIKHCQRLSLADIAKAIQELSHKARSGNLSNDEISEGSITLTNFGMSGVSIGVPIIRYPEVAIVGVGAIQKRVIALEDDLLAVRSMLHISLTFDHRVLDGMYGCGFLNHLKKHLEEELSLS